METLESLREYIPKVIDVNNTLIQLFREENTLKAFELFPSFIEGLNWVIQASVLINKQNTLFVFDMPAINSFLTEINEGIYLNDFVIVADILEYEIMTLLEEVLTEIKG